MASARVKSVELIFANAVRRDAFVSLFAFVDVQFAPMAVPAEIAMALAAIEIFDALSVFAPNAVTNLLERTIVDANVFELFDEKTIFSSLKTIVIGLIER